MRWREWEMWCLHKKLDLIYQSTFPASHLDLRKNCPAILPWCSNYFVASEGDTAASSCEQSLLSHHEEVLQLLFVVMLLLIVASGCYLLALESCSAISTTQWLYSYCKFWHLSALFRLIIVTQFLLGCLVLVANAIKIGDFLQYFGCPAVVIQS